MHATLQLVEQEKRKSILESNEILFSLLSRIGLERRHNVSALQSVDKALRESLAFISIQRRNDALYTKR